MIARKKQPKTIDDYIEAFPEDVQKILERMRQTIRKAAPEAAEAISYQMPTFKLGGKNLVDFAAFKNHSDDQLDSRNSGALCLPDIL